MNYFRKVKQCSVICLKRWLLFNVFRMFFERIVPLEDFSMTWNTNDKKHYFQPIALCDMMMSVLINAKTMHFPRMPSFLPLVEKSPTIRHLLRKACIGSGQQSPNQYLSDVVANSLVFPHEVVLKAFSRNYSDLYFQVGLSSDGLLIRDQIFGYRKRGFRNNKLSLIVI